ncbi:MAG: ATP-binding protein [Gammaproteobacteria bacterium]
MRKTLFVKIAIIISSALLLLQVLSVAVGSYYMKDTSDKERAVELASLIVLAAQTYVDLPEDSKKEFAQKLKHQDHLILGRGNEHLDKSGAIPLYYRVVARQVSERIGSPVRVVKQAGKSERYWLDMALDGEHIRLGLNKRRSEWLIPTVAIMIMGAIALIAILASLYLMKKITKPLERMAVAAKTIGRGQKPEPLEESGLQEFSDTAKAFNQMSRDIHDLLENRTILLSGISHDIRTPLTRLALVTEMLPKETDDELQEELRSVHRDIERIVAQYLSLTRSLDTSDTESIVFSELLSDVIAELTFETNQKVILSGDENVVITTSTYALRAVVINILSNALRYGAGQSVDVYWESVDNSLEISILDRGLGIPDAQKEAIFQPFYRLEGSRNVTTGGTGLGLAIVNQIVKQYDWKIEVRDRIGGGTKVIVRVS